MQSSRLNMDGRAVLAPPLSSGPSHILLDGGADSPLNGEEKGRDSMPPSSDYFGHSLV